MMYRHQRPIFLITASLSSHIDMMQSHSWGAGRSSHRVRPNITTALNSDFQPEFPSFLFYEILLNATQNTKEKMKYKCKSTTVAVLFTLDKCKHDNRNNHLYCYNTCTVYRDLNGLSSFSCSATPAIKDAQKCTQKIKVFLSIFWFCHCVFWKLLVPNAVIILQIHLDINEFSTRFT